MLVFKNKVHAIKHFKDLNGSTIRESMDLVNAMLISGDIKLDEAKLFYGKIHLMKQIRLLILEEKFQNKWAMDTAFHQTKRIADLFVELGLFRERGVRNYGFPTAREIIQENIDLDTIFLDNP